MTRTRRSGGSSSTRASTSRSTASSSARYDPTQAPIDVGVDAGRLGRCWCRAPAAATTPAADRTRGADPRCRPRWRTARDRSAHRRGSTVPPSRLDRGQRVVHRGLEVEPVGDDDLGIVESAPVGQRQFELVWIAAVGNQRLDPCRVRHRSRCRRCRPRCWSSPRSWVRRSSVAAGSSDSSSPHAVRQRTPQRGAPPAARPVIDMSPHSFATFVGQGMRITPDPSEIHSHHQRQVRSMTDPPPVTSPGRSRWSTVHERVERQLATDQQRYTDGRRRLVTLLVAAGRPLEPARDARTGP